MYKDTEPKIIVCKSLPDAMSALHRIFGAMGEPGMKRTVEDDSCDCTNCKDTNCIKHPKFEGLRTQLDADDLISIVKNQLVEAGQESIDGRAVITHADGEELHIYVDMNLSILKNRTNTQHKYVVIKAVVMDDDEVADTLTEVIRVPFVNQIGAWDSDEVRADFDHVVQEIEDMLHDYLVSVGFLRSDDTEDDLDLSEAEKVGLIEDGVRTHIQQALIVFLSDRAIRKEVSSIQLSKDYKVEFSLMYTSIKDRSVNVDFVIQTDRDGQTINCDRGHVKIDLADLRSLRGVEAAIENVLEAVVISWNATMTTWNDQPMLTD